MSWALVDHISTLVIALATIVGFVTLFFSQRALHADDRRRKAQAAIEQNEKFSSETITAYKELRDDYRRMLRSVDLQSEELLQLTLPKNFTTLSTLHGNRLESFALYIEAGLVDEDLLFRVAGKPYCEQVKNLAALCGMTTDDAVESWPSVYNLHLKWAERLKNQVVPYVPPSI